MHWSIVLFGIFIAVNGSPRYSDDYNRETSGEPRPVNPLPHQESLEVREESWQNDPAAVQNEIDRALNDYDNKQLTELVNSIAKDLRCDGGSCESDQRELDDQKDICIGSDCRSDFRCDGGSCESDQDEQDDQKDSCSGSDCRSDLRCGCGGRGDLRCGCGGRGDLRCGCGGRGDLRCGCGGRGNLRCGGKRKKPTCGCGRSGDNQEDLDSLRCGCGGGYARTGDREDLRCGGVCKKKKPKRPTCGCGRSGDNQEDLYSLRCGCGGGYARSEDREELDSLRCGCGGGYARTGDREDLRCGGVCKKKKPKRPTCGCGRSGDNPEDSEDLDSLRCGCGGRGDLRSCKKRGCCCKKKKKCPKFVPDNSDGSFEDLTHLSGLRCGGYSGCGSKKKKIKPKPRPSCGCGRTGDRDSYEDSEQSEELTRNSLKLYDSEITDPEDVSVVLGALFERCKSAKCVVNEIGEDDLEVDVTNFNKYDGESIVTVRVQNLLGYLARIGDSLDSKDSKASTDSKDNKKRKSLFPKSVYQAKKLKQKVWSNNLMS